MRAGELACVVGPNGAGKTTLINAIAGLQAASEGTLTMDGREMRGLPPHRFCGAGIAIVPEGRRLFTRMSVRENLEVGSYLRAARRERSRSLESRLRAVPVSCATSSTCRPDRSPAASSRWWRSVAR